MNNPINLELLCPSCSHPVTSEEYFCPNCGKKLKNPPMSTSLARQIFLYVFAILLPPFGLIPGIRYLKQRDNISKHVGMTLISLTIVSILVNIYIIVAAYSKINAFLNTQLGGSLQFGGTQNVTQEPGYMKNIGL